MTGEFPAQRARYAENDHLMTSSCNPYSDPDTSVTGGHANMPIWSYIVQWPYEDNSIIYLNQTPFNKANLSDLIAATGLVFLLKIGFKSLIFGTVWPGNLMEKTIGYLFYIMTSFLHHFKAIGEFQLRLQSGNAQYGSKLAIFCLARPQSLKYNLEKQ